MRDRFDPLFGLRLPSRELVLRRGLRAEVGERVVERRRERAGFGGPARVDLAPGRRVGNEALAPGPAVLGIRDELLDQRDCVLPGVVGVVDRAERARNSREAVAQKRDELDLRMHAGPEQPVALQQHAAVEHERRVRLVDGERALGARGRTRRALPGKPAARPIIQQPQQRAPQRLADRHGIALRLAARVLDLDDPKGAVPRLELGANGRGDRVARLAGEPALSLEPLEQRSAVGHVSP